MVFSFINYYQDISDIGILPSIVIASIIGILEFLIADIIIKNADI